VNPDSDQRAIFEGAPARIISEEFAYAGIFQRDEKVSAWLLNFYQSLEFFATMETEWGQSANSP